MGQKINPIFLRLASTNRFFDDCWYSDYFYSDLVSKQIKTRYYINSILKEIKYPLARIYIQSFQKKTKIFIFFCSPKKSRKIRFQSFGLKEYKKKKIKFDTIFIKKIFKKILKKKITICNFKTLQIHTKQLSKKLQTYKRQLAKKLYFRQFVLYNSIYRNKKLNCNSLLDYPSYSLFSNSLLKKKLTQYQNNKKLFFSYKKEKILTQLENYIHFLKKKKLNRKKLTDLKKLFFCLKNNLSFLRKIKVYKTIEYFRFFSLNLKKNIKEKDGNQTIIYRKTTKYKHKPKTINLLNSFSFLPLKFIHFGSGDQQFYKEKTPFKPFLKSFFHQFANKEFNCFKQLSYPIKKKLSYNLLVGNDFIFCYSLILTNKYKNHLEGILSKKDNIKYFIYPYKINNDFRSALFLAEEIVYYIQRKVSFTKIRYKLLDEVKKNSFVKGLRIVCSGRVGGRLKKAQKAKKASFLFGQTSLNVFSSSIDFASKTAFTRFGSIGVKVWISFE